MLLQNGVHLTYCLNVHPGEGWEDQRRAIQEKAVAVREAVGRGRPFGLGLRLSHQAVVELAEPGRRAEARALFEELGMYVFTVNGFPYGRFHGTRVKEAVYAPDWRTDERLEYTRRLGEILAEWLPEGVEGSISTVPGSFGPWIRSEADVRAMVANLCECALHFHRLEEATGKEIHLGLEPEPSCFLETTSETVAFFRDQLWRQRSEVFAKRSGMTAGRAEELLQRHVGVCVDTCHCAVGFEDPAAALRQYSDAGIRISKVQISAALACAAGDREELRGFDEPVYLHQVRGRDVEGNVKKWLDLPEFFEESLQGIEEVRVHFHVPLFGPAPGQLRNTAAMLEPSAFAEMARLTRHWEIETYTFHALPPELQMADVAESVAREYEWVLAHLRKLQGSCRLVF